MTNIGSSIDMNGKLNRSFSQLFQAPLLPSFGKSEDGGSSDFKAMPEEEDSIDKMLALRLPKRSGGRKRTSKGKSNNHGSSGESDGSGRTTASTSSPDSSSSSIIGQDIDVMMMDSSDDGEEHHIGTQSQKDAFESLKDKLVKEESRRIMMKKPSRPSSPGHNNNKSPKPSKVPLRRTMSEGTSLVKKTAGNQQGKTRKSTVSVMSSKSMIPRSPRRSAGGAMSDESTRKSKSAVQAKDSTSNHHKCIRRNHTGSNKSTYGHGGSKSSRRAPLRESTAEMLRSQSPPPQSVSAGSNNKHERRDSGMSASGTKQRRRRSGSGTAPTAPPTDTTSTWTCYCGFVLRDRMKFCGMCGTPKHWTCQECQFNENLCQFAFCGDCGIPRKEAAAACGPTTKNNKPSTTTDPFSLRSFLFDGNT